MDPLNYSSVAQLADYTKAAAQHNSSKLIDACTSVVEKIIANKSALLVNKDTLTQGNLLEGIFKLESLLKKEPTSAESKPLLASLGKISNFLQSTLQLKSFLLPPDVMKLVNDNAKILDMPAKSAADIEQALKNLKLLSQDNVQEKTYVLKYFNHNHLPLKYLKNHMAHDFVIENAKYLNCGEEHKDASEAEMIEFFFKHPNIMTLDITKNKNFNNFYHLDLLTDLHSVGLYMGVNTLNNFRGLNHNKNLKNIVFTCYCNYSYPNRLRGTLHNDTIEYLKLLNLESLTLEGYDFTNLLPAFSDLGNLQKLCLSTSLAYTENIKFISKNKNITHLELIEVDMHDSACKYIYEMENLKSLSFDCCEDFEKGCLIGISKLKNLETLNIADINFNQAEFAELVQLSNLKELTLSCKLKSKILDTLKNIPNLQRLNYEGKALSAELAKELSSFNSLKFFSGEIASDEVRTILEQSGITLEGKQSSHKDYSLQEYSEMQQAYDLAYQQYNQLLQANHPAAQTLEHNIQCQSLQLTNYCINLMLQTKRQLDNS